MNALMHNRPRSAEPTTHRNVSTTWAWLDLGSVRWRVPWLHGTARPPHQGCRLLLWIPLAGAGRRGLGVGDEGRPVRLSGSGRMVPTVGSFAGCPGPLGRARAAGRP